MKKSIPTFINSSTNLLKSGRSGQPVISFQPRRMSSSRIKGFTLIEVMITLSILAVLSVFTAQSLQQAFRSKVKIQDQIDTISQSRDTLRIIEKDIQLAYHYRDLEKEMALMVKEGQKSSTKDSQSTIDPATGAPLDPNDPQNMQNRIENEMAEEDTNQSQDPNNSKYPPYFKTEHRTDPSTQFIGSENKMDFVTLNSYRVIKDSPQANFGEVGYFVDSCKHQVVKKFDSGKCLFRRFSPLVDKNVEKGGRATQLLPDITDFQLRYYTTVKKDWIKTFKSTEKGNNAVTNRYPEAVEITLKQEVPDQKTGKKKKFSFLIMVPVHFPNNPVDAKTKKPNPAGNLQK